MAILSRNEILNADDLKAVPVPVPEWGGEVMVRGLTGRERDDFEAGMISMRETSVKVKLTNARARLVALGCVGENGKHLFSTADVHELGAKSGAALERVADKIRELSGLNMADMKELSANFTFAPSEDFASN